MKRIPIYYLFALILFIFSIIGILSFGKSYLEIAKTTTENTVQQNTNLIDIFSKTVQTNAHHDISRLIIQIVTIIVFARFFGLIIKQLGQPAVIGEIAAGILLGPSFIGHFFPNITAFIFPDDSLKILQTVSQLGLILFMFIVGMELDIDTIKSKAKSAIFTSHVSIMISIALGMSLSILLYKEFMPKSSNYIAFSLFMGASMSITAFPVLARIIQERGIIKTPIGLIAITVAAMDDFTAWMVLAIVLAIVKAESILSIFVTIIITITFISFMIFIIRPILQRMANIYISREIIGKGVMSAVIVLVFGSALVTELIGIHALFGAFIAGVIMPSHSRFRRIITDRIEDLSISLLLPLFFAYTGLRTQIGLLNDWHTWSYVFLIIAIASIGKFIGATIGSRVSGLSWRETFTLGALINTRGLVELVFLNIGYDLGILSPTIFVMMVLMALATTFMTGPLLTLINLPIREDNDTKVNRIAELLEKYKYKILLPFGPPESGLRLYRLVSGLINRSKKIQNTSIIALHLSPPPDFSVEIDDRIDEKQFSLILEEAQNDEINIQTLLLTSTSISSDIAKVSQTLDANLIILGAAQTVFGKKIIAGKVKEIIKESPTHIGVFMDMGLSQLESIAIVYRNESENFLLELGKMYNENSNIKITIFHPESTRFLDESGQKINFEILDESKLKDKFDLIIMDIEYWDNLNERKSEIINSSSSTSMLIIKIKH